MTAATEPTPWRPSRATTVLIGVLTVWPIVYMILFFGFIAFSFTSARSGNDSAFPALFAYILPLHLLTILLMFALMAVYIVHAYRSDRIPNDRRILWVIILIFGGLIAFPVYWYLYLWRERRPAGWTPA